MKTKVAEFRLRADEVDEIVRKHIQDQYPEHAVAVDVEYDFDIYDSDRTWFDGYSVVVHGKRS